MSFKTEFEFSLPKGYVDTEGNLHKDGSMRLATAADEILPQKDTRVHQNPAYLVMIVFSRVIKKIGDLSNITPKTIEGLFSSDLAYLQDFYNRINENGTAMIKTKCPKCEHEFEVGHNGSGE
jgi:hypothetical protein